MKRVDHASFSLNSPNQKFFNSKTQNRREEIILSYNILIELSVMINELLYLQPIPLFN